MNYIKRAVIVLCVLLLAAVPAGCKPLGQGPGPSAQAGDDLTKQLAGIGRDTALVTVNGTKIPAEEYLFWLYQSVSYLDQSAKHSGQEGIDWSQTFSGMSIADSCKNDALETVKFYAIVEQRAAEEGHPFNEEDAADLQSELDAMIEMMGGQEQYELWLSRNALSLQAFEHINQVSYAYQNLQDALYGEGSPGAPTAEDMDVYIRESDLLSSKHILLLTVDTNSYDFEAGDYTGLPEDEVAQKRRLADELLARLRASDDPISLFDSLMLEYSEDGGLATNPDGYVFTAGSMVPEFEATTRALEYGDISGVVHSSLGFHIILRQDPDTEALRQEWIAAQMNALLEELMANADVTLSDAYEDIDPRQYYANLLEHQSGLGQQGVTSDEKEEER